MKILLTGASSFTGFWFVRKLVEAGHELICPLRGAPEQYQGLRQKRAAALQPLCRLVPHTPFGSPAFLELIRHSGPIDLLCHHAAEVGNYKSVDFNLHQAVQNNTFELPAVLRALQAAKCRAVVLTGTVFEPDEGIGSQPLRAFSPYGLSKGLTWQIFRYHCGLQEVSLGKFVLPNPFGPFEEERFTAYLMKTWQAGQPAAVKTPQYIRDNIPASLLARVYVQFVAQCAATTQPLLHQNPSGYVESQGDFAQRVAREIRSRLNWGCELKLMPQTEFGEPLLRINHQPAISMVPDWDEGAAWDAFADYYAHGARTIA